MSAVAAACVRYKLNEILISSRLLLQFSLNVKSTFVISRRTMRLMRFRALDGTIRLGAEIEPVTSNCVSVVDLTSALESAGLPLNVSSDSVELISAVSEIMQTVESAVKSKKHCISVNERDYLAPVVKPDKVLCIGLNYRDHCEEQGVPVPTEPMVFSKFSSCIVGPHDNILYTDETTTLDWEVELAVVVGKKGKNIKLSEAMEHVFGYTVAHDVSERTWQLKRNGGQFLLGKTMDTFCPLGPVIVTKDEIPDPHNLMLSTKVNGVIKQESNTRQMVHQTPQLIAFISRFVTLFPGDVILTGTPPGVGCFRKPPEYLKEGDVVECEIQNIGCIVNKICRTAST